MAGDRIVVTRQIPAAAHRLLETAGEVYVSPLDRPMTAAELCQAVAGASGLVSMLHDRVDGHVLDAAGPGLRVVSNVAVGYDNLDVPAFHERGVIATNTPDVLVDATADLTIALLLAVTRRVVEADALLRRGEPWSWHLGFMVGTGLQGKQLGLVGFGRIGKAVAHRAEAFGMNVVHAGSGRSADVEAGSAGHMALDELLETSDFVSLHCPLNDDTRHLINARALARMKASAFLVNTARGPVVDEAALAEAIELGVIRGAALDVFEGEPLVNPRLLASDRVVLTPHIGSATTETRTAMAVLAARNVVAVLTGQPALTPVT
jgi:glyoxylate reductase